MVGRPKVPLVLTTPEQQALDSLAHRARTAPQVARDRQPRLHPMPAFADQGGDS